MPHPTMIENEEYWGRPMVVVLSEKGHVTASVWPCRILGKKTGGPTITVGVWNDEVIRWDCHGKDEGHYHAGSSGYTKGGAGPTRLPFPNDILAGNSSDQVVWSLASMENIQQMLEDAGYVAQIEGPMLAEGIRDIRAHLNSEDHERLRKNAVADGLIKE